MGRVDLDQLDDEKIEPLWSESMAIVVHSGDMDTL